MRNNILFDRGFTPPWHIVVLKSSVTLYCKICYGKIFCVTFHYKKDFRNIFAVFSFVNILVNLSPLVAPEPRVLHVSVLNLSKKLTQASGNGTF